MKPLPTLSVLTKRCDQCLFSAARIVSDKRKAEVLKLCARKGNYFVCHKTDGVGCRGFYDEQPSQAQQVLGRLGMLEFVELKDVEKS